LNESRARKHLPIPDRPHVGLTTYDAKDPATSFPPIEPLRPPDGAPNVLIVLIDDVGFAASSAFGGPISTPTAERLAANGLKYKVDGEQVGEGRVDGTVPMLFSADETTDVGSDTATPVSDDYGLKDSAFTGTVRWVQLDIDAAAEDIDHLIGPEERLRVAMARQ
jgi:Sulfatase